MTVKATRKKTPSITCSHCKAKLEFEYADLEGAYFDADYTEPGPEGVGVRCPDCKTLTEYKNAPGTLISEVWARKRTKTKTT
jgi:hypothetical protein